MGQKAKRIPGVHKSSGLPEVELSYIDKRSATRKQITTAEDAVNLLRQIWDKGRIEHTEDVMILLFNRANFILGWAYICRGGVHLAAMDMKIIFQTVLCANACSFIIAHNHPSGNVKPSKTDIQLTKNIDTAAEILGVHMHDHIILTKDSVYSITQTEAYKVISKKVKK